MHATDTRNSWLFSQRVADGRRSGASSSGFKRSVASATGEADTRLVERAVTCAKAGDQEALHFLYVRYADNVYGFVRSIVRDDHEAEDVTQEVFAKLLGVLGKYEQRGLPFRAWILRVARNAAIDHLRSRRALLCADVYGPDERADTEGFETGAALTDALRALPPDQRSVLYMRHVLGLSPGDIAQRLGRTEASVHGLHHRGRSAMRAALEQLELAPSTRA